MDVSAGSQGGAKSRDLEGCLDESVRAMTGLKATIFVSNVVECAVEKEEHCCHSLSVRLGREEIGMPPPLARKAEPRTSLWLFVDTTIGDLHFPCTEIRGAAFGL